MKIVVAALLSLCLNLMFGQSEQNIPTDDGIIHFKTFGEGEPLLIINGGPGMNSDGFIPLAQRLGQSNQTIVYDQRGTGQSRIAEVNSNTITMDLMVADIERIRNALNIDKWTILGHSFGGMLASYYATKHPNRIEALILSSSGGIDMGLFSRISIRSRLSNTQRDSLDYWNNKIARGDTSYFTRLQRGKNLAPAYLYNQENAGVVAERLTQGNSLINGLVYQDMRKINFDCSEDLKALEAPVLIIQGKQDLIDRQTADRAMAVFKNAKLTILERCNHYGWLDRPKTYFENIENFLTEVNKRKNG